MRASGGMTSQSPTSLKSGDRVHHPKLGLGQVLDVDGGKAEIFFVDAGLKKILLSRFALSPLVPRPADPRLDRLDLGASANASARSYRNVPECVEYFLTEYPEGFYGEKYLAGERNYKADTRREALELLSRDALDGLLEEGDHNEVCRRAKTSLTNVVNWRESDLLWKQVLGDDARERAFATRLRTLLYGPRSAETAFEQFVSWLDSLGAAKWPLSTYFRWIMFPELEVLVQPNSVKAAAAAWRYDVGYRSEVTWDGYRQIRDFFQVVRDELAEVELAEVEPRDFIDVQFFMWVVSWQDG